jgi:nucleoid DNA-binding protein
LNKLQFTEELAARLVITQTDSEHFLNAAVALIYEKTASGEPVNISGFGQFLTSHRIPRLAGC